MMMISSAEMGLTSAMICYFPIIGDWVDLYRPIIEGGMIP